MYSPRRAIGIVSGGVVELTGAASRTGDSLQTILGEVHAGHKPFSEFSVADQALITVAGNGMLGVPGIAARTFGAMHRSGISVSLISQASSEHSICFTVPQASAGRARAALVEAFADEIARREIDGIEVRPGMATLAVVGPGMATTPYRP